MTLVATPKPKIFRVSDHRQRGDTDTQAVQRTIDAAAADECGMAHVHCERAVVRRQLTIRKGVTLIDATFDVRSKHALWASDIGAS